MIDISKISAQEYNEKMVLGRALQFPHTRRELRLLPEHFFDDRHAALYEKLANDLSYSKEDLMTDVVRSKGRSDYGSVDFVQEIVTFPVSSEHGMINDLAPIYEAYAERTLKQMMAEYLNAPSNNLAIKISDKVEEIDKFNLKGNDEKLRVLAEILDDLNGINQSVVYKTGFKSLDNIVSGFEKNQLNVVAARPSMGKTAFGLELSKNLAESGAEVVFVSIESKHKNIAQRLLASIAKVDLYKFKDPINRMSKEEMQSVTDAMTVYNNMSLTIREESYMTPNTLRQIINEFPEDKNVFVVIDYLQLMRVDGNSKGEYEDLTDVSWQLKMITQKYDNVTLIPMAQLNRGVESRNDKRPNMSDLRGSGQLEQDASMIMMLYRDDYYNPPEDIDPKAPSPLEVIVTKNKDGGLGTAELEFYKQIQKIY